MIEVKNIHKSFGILAVLKGVDLTVEKCEIVSIMRYAPNCLILGGKSGGGGGMPLSYELPNGWIVRFSSVRMYDRDKISIEGGVEPDKVVNMTSLTTDDIIDEAVRIINYAYDNK